ncbi:MAG: phage tail sheath subtilisin-like domain-containing protein [Anaerolineae bacterium]
MPVTPTYPGVYIEEIPSGVRTITGVATSITAFIGRAPRGPTNEPVTLNSFGDFERRFGGLHVNYPLSYAVRDFYLNGGSQAIVVRLYVEPEEENGGDGNGDGNGNGAAATKALLTIGDLTLEAVSEGTWANALRARVDHDVSDQLAWLATYGLTKDDLFNLTVRDTATGTTEAFLNVSVKESPRRVDRVLEHESSLLRVHGEVPSGRPGKHADADSKDIWADNDPATSSKVTTEAADSGPLDQAAYLGSRNEKTGVYALEKADLFNLLCIPPDERSGNVPPAVWQAAMAYCAERRAMLIVDPPAEWGKKKETAAAEAKAKLGDLGLSGIAARNTALYFPRVRQADPLREGQLDTFVPCGIVAGVTARTDVQRGVWKAPAGIDAGLNGTQGLEVNLTDQENGMLNPLGINCLRSFPIVGRVVWGARTLRGADLLADEYKYIPVRRLALYIEESLYRGTQWVVFEPNDEPLWAQIRLNVGAFMHNLFRQGAFQGQTPREAYFVKCDSETTTQNDINLGIVNIVVGFAPLKPAEFVIIKLQQMAGQIQT